MTYLVRLHWLQNSVFYSDVPASVWWCESKADWDQFSSSIHRDRVINRCTNQLSAKNLPEGSPLQHNLNCSPIKMLSPTHKDTAEAVIWQHKSKHVQWSMYLSQAPILENQPHSWRTCISVEVGRNGLGLGSGVCFLARYGVRCHP